MAGVVAVSTGGREGKVRYSEGGARVIEGYFELGGNDVLAVFSFGEESDWRRLHGWAVSRRAEILHFIAAELVRTQSSSATPEIDETSGVILLRQGKDAASPAAPSARRKAAAFVWRLGALRSALAVAVLASTVLLGGLAVLGQTALTRTQSPGAPLNESLRLDGGIATLISRTDPQGPRWSGRGGDETATLSLLLIPFDGGESRMTQLVRGVAPGSLSLARVLGSDGATLWVDAGGLHGVRLRDRSRVTAEELRRANPGLDPSWWEDSRGISISEGRLHVVRRDGSAALDIDPESLRAHAVSPRRSSPRPSPPDQAESMAKGFMTSDGAWMELLDAKDRAGDIRAGRLVRPIETADATNTERMISRAALEASPDRSHFRIRSVEILSDTPYLNAGFLRVNSASEPVRVEGPRGALMIHTARPATTGTLLVSRVDEAGQVVWTAETGLDRFTLRQILTGERVSAFVGARLPKPGQVSEPLVVLVDHETGGVATHTLWR